MYTLITGATGLVGRYLLRDLLLNGHDLAVVVRASKREDPQDRIEQILQHWEAELGRALPRPVVLSGDIAEAGFGLSEEDRQWVKDNVNCIMHSAAILEFYGEDRSGEPWRTNLGGTRNMIALCRELDIRDIHYVSTAYVAGMTTDRVMEDSLDNGQTFRNDYEHSKFLAEKEVRAIDFADHVTIYRPAVISGDSVTGYTNTYHGIYLYLRLMALMIPSVPIGENGKRHTPVRLRFTGDERRNVIPVDWISAVMVRLFETPEARGGTYHMAPDKPLKARDMIEWCGEFFNSTGVEFMGPDYVYEELKREDNEDQWLFERMVIDNMGTYEPYESTDNVFDMTNMKRFAADIVCPEIDRTVIYRYIEFGEADRWGKSRPPKLDRVSRAEDVLAGLQASEVDDNATVLGLDVQGPGGGQFTIALTSDGEGRLLRGLPSDDATILRLQVADLEMLRTAQNVDAVSGEQFGSVPKSVIRQLQEVLAQSSQLASA
ncbi:MAG: SDR family oxidoreductase [Planctomycetaceae bacterium]